MTLAELLAKYGPKPTLKSEPLKDCPTCKGEGEFMNKQPKMTTCMCVALGGSDELRMIVVRSFRKTIASLSAELQERKKRR